MQSSNYKWNSSKFQNELDGDITLTVEDNNHHDDTANNDQENDDDVNETVIHEKTILETSTKPIKSEIFTAVTDATVDEQSLDESKVEVLEEVQAPLASMEHDPAPFASLESANSSDLQSMWNFFEKKKKKIFIFRVLFQRRAPVVDVLKIIWNVWFYLPMTTRFTWFYAFL